MKAFPLFISQIHENRFTRIVLLHDPFVSAQSSYGIARIDGTP